MVFCGICGRIFQVGNVLTVVCMGMENTTKWLAGSKRKRLVGTVLFGLGVLLEVIQGYIRFPLGLRAKTVELLLMSFGVIFLSWGPWISILILVRAKKNAKIVN